MQAEGVETKRRDCGYCGKPFAPEGGRRFYCSPLCTRLEGQKRAYETARQARLARGSKMRGEMRPALPAPKSPYADMPLLEVVEAVLGPALKRAADANWLLDADGRYYPATIAAIVRRTNEVMRAQGLPQVGPEHWRQ